MVWTKSKDILIGGKIPLAVYHSNRSNLRVFIAETPGPMVEGRISIVTETHTNDGLPHTLEHMVFMGSEMYPYKGMLDIIANRCFASGTNAYTDQDHTCYQLATAGSSGFLKLLPVYLDHILQPTLTESQYLTEVHHINGQGQNSGVVYSEMQAKDNDMDRMVDRMRKELFYPEGSSYGAVTGGLLSDIRQLCSLERVRNFHKKFYHLSNMYITVCGQIGHQKLLDAIEPLEGRNLDSIPRHFASPFETRILPLNEAKILEFSFPSGEDTSVGVVEMSWLGPPGSDFQTTRALMILFDYLTDTAVAPLRKDFVQIEDPFCTSVGICLMEQRDCEIVACFEGVPEGKLEQIQDHFFDKTVVDHQLLEAFDVERIGFILDQQIRQFHSKLENRSTSLIASAVVSHQLLGQTEDPQYVGLEQCLNEADILRQFKARPALFWHDLFHQWLAKRNCACVIGKPSKNMSEAYEKTEAERIKQQIAKLGGEEGLKKCQKRLDDAIDENTRAKPSDDALVDFIVRDFKKFNTIQVTTTTNLEHPSNDFVGKFPFTTVLHTVTSDFFEATIVIDTDGISADDRHFLPLWFQLMFQSPATIEGNEISYEEVAKLATRDLVPQFAREPRVFQSPAKMAMRDWVTHSVSVGISGVYDRFIALRLKTTADNVSNLAKWANIYLKGVLFRSDRVVICARNLANNAAVSKRDGNTVCHFLNEASTYTPEATTHFFSYLGLEKFHKGVAKAVENGRSDEVLGRLESLRNQVLAAPMNVHFSGDPSRIQLTGAGDGSSTASVATQMADQWDFLDQPFREQPFQPLLQCPADYRASTDMFGESRAITVCGADSAFLLQKTRFDDTWGEKQTNKFRKLQYAQKISNLCWQVWNAKAEDVLTHGGPPLRRLFDAPQSFRSIALNPSRQKELEEHFPNTNIIKLDELQLNFRFGEMIE